MQTAINILTPIAILLLALATLKIPREAIVYTVGTLFAVGLIIGLKNIYENTSI